MRKPKKYSRRQIRAAVQAYNEATRDWIVYSFWRDEPVEQIARDHGLSYSAVRTFLFNFRYNRMEMGVKEMASISARLNR